jgi:hypothetical protein
MPPWKKRKRKEGGFSRTMIGDTGAKWGRHQERVVLLSVSSLTTVGRYCAERVDWLVARYHM